MERYILIFPGVWQEDNHVPCFVFDVMASSPENAVDRINASGFVRFKLGTHQCAIFKGDLGLLVQPMSHVRMVRL
jgi:hypothetical protein